MDCPCCVHRPAPQTCAVWAVYASLKDCTGAEASRAMNTRTKRDSAARFLRPAICHGGCRTTTYSIDKRQTRWSSEPPRNVPFPIKGAARRARYTRTSARRASQSHKSLVTRCESDVPAVTRWKPSEGITVWRLVHEMGAYGRKTCHVRFLLHHLGGEFLQQTKREQRSARTRLIRGASNVLRLYWLIPEPSLLVLVPATMRKGMKCILTDDRRLRVS